MAAAVALEEPKMLVQFTEAPELDDVHDCRSAGAWLPDSQDYAGAQAADGRGPRFRATLPWLRRMHARGSRAVRPDRDQICPEICPELRESERI
jgi:hypothetical protein